MNPFNFYSTYAVEGKLLANLYQLVDRLANKGASPDDLRDLQNLVALISFDKIDLTED